MNLDEISPLARQLSEVVTTAMDEIRPNLLAGALTGDLSEQANTRHTDNFLSKHDLWMHRRYQQLFLERLGPFVYASEEADPQLVGDDPDPDLCLLVDPLDTSELAVRGLLGYTHVLAYSRRHRRPVAAVVGDIYHHVHLYGAAWNGSDDIAFAQTRDGQVSKLDVSQSKARDLSEAIVTNFLMKPSERFQPLAAQHRLIDALAQPNTAGKAQGRIGVDFGSVGLCHVAAGFTDAMIEFAKGFAVWDLAPGHYILNAAGGVVANLDGTQMKFDYQLSELEGIAATMNERRHFIATRTTELAAELATLIDP